MIVRLPSIELPGNAAHPALRVILECPAASDPKEAHA
jgi:hypothetical protein